jgi:hypothetical protein
VTLILAMVSPPMFISFDLHFNDQNAVSQVVIAPLLFSG